MDEMKNQLLTSTQISQGPYGETRALNGVDDSEHSAGAMKTKRKGRGRGGYGRDQHYVVRDLILALSLCHNVTPVYPDADDPEKKEF